MKVFTIDSDNNITIHDSRKAARETGASVFDSEENFGELIGPDNKRLVAIFNSLTGVTPVKKFTSRALGISRIWKELQKLAGPEVVEAEASPAEAPVEPKTRGTKRPRGPKAAKEPKKTGKKAKPATGGTSKKDMLMALISRKEGATLEELMAATGWQKHSVRGAIATMGKTTKIESSKSESGARTYKAA